MIVEHDTRSVSALLLERGISISSLDAKDDALIIGLAESPRWEVLIYINALVEALGFKRAWVSYRGQVWVLE